jgi:hypothetical protein
VDHEDFPGCDLVVTRQRRHGLAATVHEGLRFEQKYVSPVRLELAFVGVETLFETKALWRVST